MSLTKITLDALGSSITINADALTSGTVPLNRLSAANSSANGIVTTSGQTFAGDKTFQNTVTVTGNLTVLGTSVTLNSETVLIKDNIITLNSNVTGAPVLDAGIEVNRGTSANVTFKWNETSDIWQLTNDGTNYGDVLTTLSSTGINASALSTGTVPLGRLSSANSSANGVVDTTTQTFAGNKTFQNTASFSNTVSITGAANALSTFGVGGTLSALGQLSVTGNATFDTSTLFVDATNDRVGIGTASPAYPLEISKSQGTQLRLIGGSTGYTQGSLLIQSSTTDTPQSRGLGMYLFNEGTDVNWYAGTLYNDGDAFGITRKANASFDIAAADVASMLFRIANTGSVSIALSGALISNVASNNVYTITSGAWGSGATGPRGIFASSAVLGTSGGGYGTVGYNVRYTSTTNSYLYAVTDVASLLVFDDGFTFKRAASGTGGNAITFSDFVRIDSSGNLLVGTTNSDIGGSVTGISLRPGGQVFASNSAAASASSCIFYGDRRGANNVGSVYAMALQGQFKAAIGVVGTSSSTDDGGITFSTISGNATITERARITLGGVLSGKTAGGSISDTGSEIATTGYGMFVISGATGLYVGRKTNDGSLVDFYQDSILEGNISVAGTTVSYNGGHLARWSQATDNTRVPLLKGTVMSNLDQMAQWADPETGEPQQNEQLNCMKVSDVEGDPNVAGVFVNWDNDDAVFTNDMNIAMTGDMIIRIAHGTTVQRGDLLMSAGDGTARPQGDDIVRSKTIAKVTSTHVTCVYDDGSYCVPCVLMAC